MGKALYRQYRPRSLDEVVGHEHVIETLKSALKSDSISHAYLLTGLRGSGKTTIARILAHEINGLPYVDDQTHLDIIEIDAASNRRIDDIRDLRDKVHISPTSAKYKVYIIDEVHMLTGESFNALLKTLEEPPAHTVFILATTEAHKIPSTILSRVQRFTFKPTPTEQVAAHLKHIAKQESITIDDEALQLIAQHGEGSFRDSITLLDQARSQSDTITKEALVDLLGVPASETIQSITGAIEAQDQATIITALESLQMNGSDALRTTNALANELRSGLVTDSHTIDNRICLQLLAKLLDVPASSKPYRFLELCLLEAALPPASIYAAPALVQQKPPKVTSPASPKSIASPVKEVPTELKKEAKTESKKTETVISNINTEKPAVAEAPQEDVAVEPAPAKSIAVGSVDPAAWPAILNEVKKKYNTLYGIARMANVSSTEDGLKLGFKFAFHQKRVNEVKNKDIIVAAIESVTGISAVLECVVDETVSSAPLQPLQTVDTTASSEEAVQESEPKPKVDMLSDISNIFGGGEVLES